ncbi:MAG: DUF6356 family protein [Parasphingorhabdus sp.]|uniref:DUF6356 family protein n=1 Tax=Parasphingorhabdus sp. TaxID=2709688 RepID=UPI003298075E
MKVFTDHPQSVGETYAEHFVVASSFGLPMILAGLACLMHGIFPFLFEKTGSNLVKKLYDRMVTNRVKADHCEATDHELEWCI